MRNRSRPFWLSLTVSLACLAAGACGDDDEASSAAPDAAVPDNADASTQPEASGPPPEGGAPPAMWTGIVPLETGMGDVGSFAVAASKNGDAMVVFEQAATLADGAVVQDIWATRYVGSTKTWTAPVRIENNPGDTGLPSVAMDWHGNAMAVWTQPDTGAPVVWAAKFTATGGWTAPQKLETEDTQGAGRPRVAMSANGTAVVVWEESDGTRRSIWGARHTTTWSTPTRLELSDETAEFPNIAINGNGNGMAIWRQRVGVNYRLFGSRYNATTGFAGALPIENSATNQVEQNFDIAVDEVGNAMAVYAYGVDANVHANVYDVGAGGWGTPTLLGPGSAGNQASPKVAMDSAGNAMVVWFLQADAKVSTRRYSPQAGWGTVTPIEPTTGVTLFPHVGIDEAGGAFSIWRQTEPGAPGVRRVLVSRSVGGSWETPTRLDPMNPGNSDSAKIAVNAGGNAFAVWTQSDGTRINLWANVYR